MTNIAFIGLGIMGSPMAVHLAKAGHEVAGYNRTPGEGRSRSSRPGAAAAESIADAVRDADVVVRDGAGLAGRQDVLTGEGGVFDNAKPGTLVIDFSSIRPDVTAAARRAGRGQGLAARSTPGLRRRGRRDERRALDHGRRRGRRLRGGQAVPRRRRQDGRARRPERSGPDREGGQPAHRRRQHRGARRGGRLPRGVRRRHRGRARSARRRAGRLEGAGPEEAEHARPVVRAGLPDRRCTTRTSASSLRPRARRVSWCPSAAWSLS